MIYSTRPVTETQKTVQVANDKKLHNNSQDRRPQEPIIIQSDLPKEGHKLNRDDLEKAVEDSNKLIFKDDSHFEFKIHERTGRILVKLVDTETDEIIKEIPPEKILDLVASIWDLVGILVDERG